MFKQQSFLLEALASLETRYLFLPLSSLNGRDNLNPHLDWHQKAFQIAIPPLTLPNCKKKKKKKKKQIETFLKLTFFIIY